MKQHFWNRDLFELADQLYDWLIKFLKEEVWPLMMGVSFFFFLAIPLLIVLGILWYLDAIHWEPEHGRYKVGERAEVWQVAEVPTAHTLRNGT